MALATRVPCRSEQTHSHNDLRRTSDSRHFRAPLAHTREMRKWGLLAVTALALTLAWNWFDGNVEKVEFFGYIHKYSHNSEQSQAWLDAHHDLVLADGHAFCDWLAEFPEVPDVVPSGEADVGKFRMRYIHSTTASTEIAVSDSARITVLAAAGAYFCNGTVESRTSFSVPEEQL